MSYSCPSGGLFLTSLAEMGVIKHPFLFSPVCVKMAQFTSSPRAWTPDSSLGPLLGTGGGVSCEVDRPLLWLPHGAGAKLGPRAKRLTSGLVLTDMAGRRS